MICVYPADCTDFSSNGLGAVTPMSCTVTETLNGEWELTLVHDIDERGKWTRLSEGCILRAPVPAAMTPSVDLVTQQYQTSTYEVQIYKITTKSGLLHLRSGTSTNYKILGKYKKGREVIVLNKTTSSWYEVTAPDGKHGYMASQYLTFQRTETQTVQTNVGFRNQVIESLQLRDQPFRIYRVVPELDKITVYARHIFYYRKGRERQGPLRTDSGGLLTGMIYCGECGERLTINHCRKVTDTLEGQREYRWSVYRCYRKINSRKTCTGQSTYNAKRIDEAVLSIVRSFFARITTLPEADQMQAAMQRENLIREKAIQTAEDDVEKATKALSALEDEALKTLSGESKLTLDTISKLIEKQKAKQTDARMKLQALLEEKQTDDEKFKAKQEQLQRTKEWAQILDIATPPRKQMILAEIIDRVEVRRGYEITVKFKLTAQQFLDPNGCEAISKIAS